MTFRNYFGFKLIGTFEKEWKYKHDLIEQHLKHTEREPSRSEEENNLGPSNPIENE